MRRRSDPRNRMAVGRIDRDDTAIGIMEWELGSRVVSELLPENEPVLALPTLRTRIAIANPRVESTPQWIIDLYLMAHEYEDCFVTLEHEDEEVYLCEGIYDDRGVPKLELLQVHPKVDDPKKKNWVVDVDLVEFASEMYQDVVALRDHARLEAKYLDNQEVTDANSDHH